MLEIGTGTGWDAALLAHRLGAEQITTIEIDPDVAAHARKALSDAGYGGVTTVVGDGALGYPPDAPYDRLTATVACTQLPYAWVAQTRPGGRIVAPSWALDYYGMLLALTVAEDGTAAGHFVDDVSFMVLRDQRTHPRYQVFRYTGEEHEQATVTETGIRPAEVASGGYARASCGTRSRPRTAGGKR